MLINMVTKGYMETLYRYINLTGKVAELSVLQKISMIAYTYQEDSELLDIIFSILYMGMIAEENKKGTHLGKE